jgi:hypothetical protein
MTSPPLLSQPSVGKRRCSITTLNNENLYFGTISSLKDILSNPTCMRFYKDYCERKYARSWPFSPLFFSDIPLSLSPCPSSVILVRTYFSGLMWRTIPISQALIFGRGLQ